MSPTAAVATGAKNAYQGQVNGNSVTFFGVPVVPPGTASGVARTFRITNIRTAIAATGTVTVGLSIANTSGQTTNPAGLFGSVASTTAVLGNVQTGLSATGTKFTASTPGLTTCAAITGAYAGTVSFAEAFNSAFRTRQLGGAGLFSAQDSTTLTQTLPGSGAVSESGFELGGFTNIGTATTAGLADFGTRLKAVFTNIPSGARVFVSFSNVEHQSTSNIGFENANFIDPAAGDILGTGAAGTSATTSFAALIKGTETGADSTGGSASVPLATPSATALGVIPANFGYAELTVSSSGSATAIWEVLNTNPSLNETFTFDVFVTQAAQGTTGTSTVNLSYAPTSSTATTIPSFVDTSGSGVSGFSITSCRTILLFPYVTSAAGFDTGLAVSNTTMDILGTTGQAGTCSLYVYGVTASTDTAPTNNGPFSPFDGGGKAFPATGVPAGQTAEWLVSQAAAGFTGYAIVTCNFQYAHGFAFVYSPVLSAAMGYLPLVLPSPVTRGSSPETSTF